MSEVAPDVAERVLGAVADLGVDAEVMPCDPALADTAAFCAHYGVDPADSANAILVASKRTPPAYALCVVLATTRLDVNGVVRRMLGGGKASFADAESTRVLTGMEIGGVTPFGLPADLPVWVDARVLQRASVVVGGGDRSRKLRLPPAALLRIPGAEAVEGLALERAAPATPPG